MVTKDWTLKLKFFKVYIPGRVLTLRQSVLYFCLRSLCFGSKEPIVHPTSVTGLAALIHVSRGTIRDAFRVLEEHDFIRVYPSEDHRSMAIHVLPFPNGAADFFRNRKVREDDLSRYPGLLEAMGPEDRAAILARLTAIRAAQPEEPVLNNRTNVDTIDGAEEPTRAEAEDDPHIRPDRVRRDLPSGKSPDHPLPPGPGCTEAQREHLPARYRIGIS